MSRIIYIFILILFLFTTKTGFAIPVEDFATEYYTMSAFIKESLIYIDQARQLTAQIQSLQIDLKNIERLSDQKWDGAQQALNNLGNAIQQGNAIAYSMQNLDAQFKKQFPGYDNPANQTNNYSQTYQKWIQTNQDTMQGVLDQINLSYSQLQDEKAVDDALASRAASPLGQMQALQVANEIAAEQIAQLQKLKATMMAQTNAQAEYYAYQGQKDAVQQQTVDAVVKNANPNFPNYQNNADFGLIPSFGDGQ